MNEPIIDAKQARASADKYNDPFNNIMKSIRYESNRGSTYITYRFGQRGSKIDNLDSVIEVLKTLNFKVEVKEVPSTSDYVYDYKELRVSW